MLTLTAGSVGLQHGHCCACWAMLAHSTACHPGQQSLTKAVTATGTAVMLHVISQGAAPGSCGLGNAVCTAAAQLIQALLSRSQL